MATRQRGQVLENADGSYSIRYYLPGGRRKQEGTWRTRGDAQRQLRRVLQAIDAGGFHGDITFDELADRWFGVYDASHATRLRVRGQLKIARDEFGAVPLRRITPEQVAAWRLTISEGQRHQAHGLLRQVLEAGVRWGHAHINPARLVKNPTPKRSEVEFLRDWSQVDAIAAEIGEPWAALVVFATGTGLRPSEWCAIERRHLDLAGRVVVVEQSWTEHDGLRRYGKTDGSRRRVPLRDRVVDALGGVPRRGLIFPATRGGHVRLRNWRRRYWVPAVEAAGLPAVTPYAMRHTYAAWSLAAGIGVFALARRMGTSVEMIDQTYGHLVHDADATEAAILDAWDANGR